MTEEADGLRDAAARLREPATADPMTALALAEWLEEAARGCDQNSRARIDQDPAVRFWLTPALAIAQAILDERKTAS